MTIFIKIPGGYLYARTWVRVGAIVLHPHIDLFFPRFGWL